MQIGFRVLSLLLATRYPLLDPRLGLTRTRGFGYTPVVVQWREAGPGSNEAGSGLNRWI